MNMKERDRIYKINQEEGVRTAAQRSDFLVIGVAQWTNISSMHETLDPVRSTAKQNKTNK